MHDALGAGEPCVFSHVSFPMLWPGFVTISLFTSTAVRNHFNGALAIRLRRSGLTAGAVK